MKKLVSVIIIGLALAGCGSSGGSGGITYSPATDSCSNPVAMTETEQLPSSVKETDTLSVMFDGRQVSSGTLVGSGWTLKPDGSFTLISQITVAELDTFCTYAGLGGVGGINLMTPGIHLEQVLDSSGKVLAQGYLTVTS